jgi:hypothetical protein
MTFSRHRENIRSQRRVSISGKSSRSETNGTRISALHSHSRTLAENVPRIRKKIRPLRNSRDANHNRAELDEGPDGGINLLNSSDRFKKEKYMALTTDLAGRNLGVILLSLWLILTGLLPLLNIRVSSTVTTGLALLAIAAGVLLLLRR